ncbi:unnamed protein product, partial [Vitis vinifera]
MARRTELGFLKTSASSLREQAARTTLRNVRMQGHPYVELREDGKRFIFFCTLCLAPCYSESVLYDHLKGNLHSERYAAAKVTLLKSHPWPFNDGVLFFDNSSENDKHLSIANGNPTRLLGTHKNDNNLAIVCHGDDLSQNRYDDQLLDTRFISSKTIRRELRRQQRVAAERMCDICQHKMLPGKDVATLMNMKTGKLVCSSRNVYGAFHVFHTSCLIHWILLCEFEIFTNQLVCPKLRRSSRRKSGSKCNGKGKDGVIKPTTLQICSVFCPECQGTGIMIEDELEIPNIPLSEMFKYKIKVSDAHRAWMKNPEELKHCSTGFNFPSQSGETVQEKVSSLKLLHFYSADE